MQAVRTAFHREEIELRANNAAPALIAEALAGDALPVPETIRGVLALRRRVIIEQSPR